MFTSTDLAAVLSDFRFERGFTTDDVRDALARRTGTRPSHGHTVNALFDALLEGSVAYGKVDGLRRWTVPAK